eukprot:357723-Chlamydomonas_euryale.AAC.4
MLFAERFVQAARPACDGQDGHVPPRRSERPLLQAAGACCEPGCLGQAVSARGHPTCAQCALHGADMPQLDAPR